METKTEVYLKTKTLQQNKKASTLQWLSFSTVLHDHLSIYGQLTVVSCHQTSNIFATFLPKLLQIMKKEDIVHIHIDLWQLLIKIVVITIIKTIIFSFLLQNIFTCIHFVILYCQSVTTISICLQEISIKPWHVHNIWQMCKHILCFCFYLI